MLPSEQSSDVDRPVHVSSNSGTAGAHAGELPSVEDLQEVVNNLRSEMETLRGNAPDEE
jgi:predicted deacylase